MILDWFVHHKRFGRFRSAFERDALAVRPLASFPRRIHLYWDEGEDSAPQLVRLCIQSWRDHHPGWEVTVHDSATAAQVVDRSRLTPGLKTVHYSDLLRTALLRRHGGVWADATLLCTRSLDDWLLQIMAQCDFFAFSRPGPDRAIGSWFLASRPGGAIITALSAAVQRFWRDRQQSTRVYHWFHYIFEYLLRTSGEFRREWRKTPRLSAVPLFAWQGQLVRGERPSAEEIALYRSLPMHKLTHKRPIDLALLATVLGGR